MDGDTLIRGCLGELSNQHTCDNAGNDCHICNENGCNAKSYYASNCVVCDSNLNPLCKTNPDNVPLTSCLSINSDDSACYLFKNGIKFLSISYI